MMEGREGRLSDTEIWSAWSITCVGRGVEPDRHDAPMATADRSRGRCWNSPTTCRCRSPPTTPTPARASSRARRFLRRAGRPGSFVNDLNRTAGHPRHRPGSLRIPRLQRPRGRPGLFRRFTFQRTSQPVSLMSSSIRITRATAPSTQSTWRIPHRDAGQPEDRRRPRPHFRAIARRRRMRLQPGRAPRSIAKP